MQKEEFSRSINIDNQKLFYGRQLFIVWKWIWGDDAQSESEESRSDSDEDNVSAGEQSVKSSSDKSDDDDDDDGIPFITHKVVFKCLESQKEFPYQEILAEVARKMKQSQSVPVKVEKEPDNPVD